jgi:hypothetical protein
MSKTTNNIQTLLDDDTLQKLNRLIMIEAFEKGEAPKGKSQWIRELIEDTVNFEPNLKKIEEYKPKHK